MKAIVKEKPVEGQEWKVGLQFKDKPEPSIQSSTDVKLKVVAGAICGTDGGIYNAKDSIRREMLKSGKDEIIIGHEFCGQIVDAGPKAKHHLAELLTTQLVEMIRDGKSNKTVNKFIGRRTAGQLAKDKHLLEILGEHFYSTAEMHVTDGTCYQCKIGEKHVCQNTIIRGVHDDGAFTSYIVVPAENIVLFPVGEIPSEIIAFMDALGNATHVVQSVPVNGKTVAILGCGVQGLMAAAVAKAAGARKIFVTDASHGNFSHEKLVENRFRLAKLFGADYCFDVSNFEEKDAFYKTVMSATHQTGVDAVFEMSGNYRAYEDAFRVVRMGGAISLLGLAAGNMSVDFTKDIIFRGITIHGIIGRRVFETWDMMRQLLKKGLDRRSPAKRDAGGLIKKFMNSGFISHDLPLAKFEEGFTALRNGDGLKILLRP